MDTFRKILQIIYYLIWIPLGIVLLAAGITLIVSNPMEKFGALMQNIGGPGGSGGFNPGQPPLQGGGGPGGQPGLGGFGPQGPSGPTPGR